MKYLSLFLFTLLVFLACQSESSSTAQQTEKQNDSAVSSTSTQSTPPAPQSAKPVANAATSVKAMNTPQTVGNITLMASNVKASPGKSTCMTISAANFTDMLSMQFTMTWDKDVLAYNEIRDFRLPFFSKANFGTNRATEGIVTALWLDNDLRGRTLADGDPIFDICFDVIGKKGDKTEFKFAQKPTPFEAVNKAEKLMGINVVNGSVSVE